MRKDMYYNIVMLLILLFFYFENMHLHSVNLFRVVR